MKLTKLQKEMLNDRLTLDDCLREVLHDTYEFEGKPLPSEDEIDQAFQRVGEIIESGDLTKATNLNETERFILLDCFEGSTWLDRAHDAMLNGEITEGRYHSEVRSFSNLYKKLESMGIIANAENDYQSDKDKG